MGSAAIGEGVGGAMLLPVGRLVVLRLAAMSFVCVGLVTITSAAIFAQLEPTHSLAQTTVREAEAQ